MRGMPSDIKLRTFGHRQSVLLVYEEPTVKRLPVSDVSRDVQEAVDPSASRGFTVFMCLSIL